MSRLGTLALLSVCLLANLALASDVDSGPAVGDKVPGLKVHDCTGENKDKSVDYAELRKDRPTVYLLIAADKFDRPMHRFLKALDEKVDKDVYIVGVWLTDDEAKIKEHLPRVQMSVKYEKTALTVFKGKDGPKDWVVNSDAHLTVIVAGKGKVTARYGYRSVNDTDAPPVLKEVAKAAKK